MFIIFFFFCFPFLFLFFLYFTAWPTTRHPLPVTRYPRPATRLPATRHPRKSPAVNWTELNSILKFLVFHAVDEEKIQLLL